MPPKEAPAQSSEGNIVAKEAGEVPPRVAPAAPHVPPQAPPLQPIIQPAGAVAANLVPENQLEQRLMNLIEVLKPQRHNSSLKNVAFEIGRPALEPVPTMRRNPANPYGRFSIDELYKMDVQVVSNNMATTEQMAKISSAIAGLGVPTEQVADVILKMVVMCASVSSSVYLDPDGSIEFDGGAVPVDSIAAIMKKEAGLRKVCRLYAPVVWNLMLVKNQPPSDWQAMGYPKEARFAAFDTFDYVTNGAAIQPVEGLIRGPTPAECIAHNAHKRHALDRSNRNEKYGNLETEYTGGLQGAEIVRNHRNAGNGSA
ncbi:Coat protein [Blueberry scorch virus]|uniref:Coat protein n=1 Tax=Blueberry scorch virus TaxID=31722 RepID=UPI0000163D41|nr:Coat protein [Blueberry scorch virus]